MYSISFGILIVQFTIADPLGIELQNSDGIHLKSSVLNFIDIDSLNTSTSTIHNTNSTTIITDPITGAATIAVELFLILTGGDIFRILYLLGVPSIVVAAMVILYYIMLSRTFIAYLRGI